MQKATYIKTGEEVSIIHRLNMAQTRILTEEGEVMTVAHADLVENTELLEHTAHEEVPEDCTVEYCKDHADNCPNAEKCFN